uniref:ATP-dependent DNA helicase n=1 Tax=Brassica oleracea var. oleracea TaxID=109376 RepID=A0A0D3E8T9_BRAOL
MACLDFVSDLKLFKSMWKVRVKVIRLWKQYSCALGETMEMVLADSKGDMIHGTVKKELVSQFVILISQGETKLMVNFIVTMAAGSYRPTKHPYRIVFLPTTRLRMCDALPSNLTGLDPVKYESINDGSLNTDYLVDVIGQIVEVSHVKVVSVNGKDTQKLSLELRNQDDDRLPMVLWGKFATDVNDAIQLRGEHKIIIVLRFGKIKVWKETNQIPAPPDGVDITGAIAVEPEVYEIKKYFDASFSLYETGLVMSDEEVLNATLILIDNLLRRETSSLANFETMPKPVVTEHTFQENQLLQDELNYDRDELSVYEQIIGAVESKKGGVFFVYGFGGTGKTFLWNILSAAIQSTGDIVLNVASSGIASLLLPGGRTAHSRFGIPINPDEFSTCNIEQGSDKAEVIAKASLIIWDEAPMMNKHCFEALDHTRLPFKMRRRQFPLKVAFAMTINKSQGQSLERVGLFLSRPVFSHGQLYVAFSRVKSRKGLKILITDNDGKPEESTMNVVYKEVFQNLLSSKFTQESH